VPIAWLSRQLITGQFAGLAVPASCGNKLEEVLMQILCLQSNNAQIQRKFQRLCFEVGKLKHGINL
jgi:hypothetical protein